MDKRIYFAGSIRSGRVDANLYQRIIAYINKTDVVLTEHIGMADISLKAQGKTSDYEIYKQDTDWLKNSDLVIAEGTCPSVGVGYELAFTEVLHIPVYIFYEKKSNLSAMLNGNSYFNIIPYEKEEEIYTELNKILREKK